MAERLYRSPDVPDFDTYPAASPTASSRSQADPALERRARQIGSTLGKAVAALRQAQGTIKDIAGETGEVAAIRVAEVKNRMSNTVKSKAQEWGTAAASQAGHLQQATLEKVADVRSRVKTGYYRTRLRANQLVREHPFGLVLAAGAVGFLLGVGLRMRRSKREY